jgi:hypothetical protein
LAWLGLAFLLRSPMGHVLAWFGRRSTTHSSLTGPAHLTVPLPPRAALCCACALSTVGANSDGVCEQKADDDSNEQTARILVALIVFFVTVLCGMCCQFMACRRVCCYDPHKEK